MSGTRTSRQKRRLSGSTPESSPMRKPGAGHAGAAVQGGLGADGLQTRSRRCSSRASLTVRGLRGAGKGHQTYVNVRPPPRWFRIKVP